jgi:hypothetical protein
MVRPFVIVIFYGLSDFDTIIIIVLQDMCLINYKFNIIAKINIIGSFPLIAYSFQPL